MIEEVIDEEVQHFKNTWMERLPIHYPILMTIEDAAEYELEEIDKMVNTLKPYWESIARHQLQTKVKEKQGNPSPQVAKVECDTSTPQMNSAQTKHNGLSEEGIPELREQWFTRFEHLFREPEPILPPKREVEHQIPLIEEDKRYTYYMPRCPDYLKEQLWEKIEKYVAAGWWYPAPATQAAPMLCIPKKDKTLQTIVDLQQQNANTHKDVTPLPDQDNIHQDVARARYRSKIDLSNVYEQVRVAEADIHKTGFATIYGTFYSRVMQQGDCNAVNSFQRLMIHIFRKHIGKFVHVYLDDIFVFSDTIEEHEKHLEIVLTLLEENGFALKQNKVQLYATDLDCLGHNIDANGIHVTTDKIDRILDWREPRDYHDV